jgi:ERF superfamily
MNDVIDIEPAKSPATTALTTTTPAQLLSMAVQQGADLDKLERLMALQERWEANEARKAFVLAMTEFKAEPMDIYKRKQVGFTGKDGNFVGYKHAELSDVADVVVPAMAKHGLSHRWEVQQSTGRIIVTCTVTHRAGHSECVTMDAAPDDSGKKNAIQQVASAVTYMQRYTLLAVCGLATKSEHDDDGRGTGEPAADPLEVWAGRAALAATEDELRLVAKDGAQVFKTARNVEGYKLFAAAVQARGAELKGATHA